jgi:predicted nucleic acid-binding protein
MILADTSVWTNALRGREPYKLELERLLRLDQIAGHDLVYGERLIGDRGDRGGRPLVLADYERMQKAVIVAHRDVVLLARSRKLHGRGAGWIDIHLLASALFGHIQLWTADARLALLAGELGVSYQTPRV